MTASTILNAIEKEMLLTFKWLGVQNVGIQQERLIRMLRSNGGQMNYQILLGKSIFYMNLMGFRQCMDTLESSGIVTIHNNLCILHEDKLRDL